MMLLVQENGDHTILSPEDEKELQKGRNYHIQAAEEARSGADWRLVNLTFENARTCFRRISDIDMKYEEIAKSYLMNPHSAVSTGRIIDFFIKRP